ncbi:unnamed protein product [Prunus armeniaca]
MRILGKVLESQDPFAFDEDDFEPSKWDVLSGNKNISLSRQNEAAYRELDDTLDDYEPRSIK